jgi:hypothetical protein
MQIAGKAALARSLVFIAPSYLGRRGYARRDVYAFIAVRDVLARPVDAALVPLVRSPTKFGRRLNERY